MNNQLALTIVNRSREIAANAKAQSQISERRRVLSGREASAGTA